MPTSPHIYCTYSHWDDAAALNAYRQLGAFWRGVAGHQAAAGRPRRWPFRAAVG
ncbi:MAG: hypothetical protein WKG07_39080 [Hymenobacter sp.]